MNTIDHGMWNAYTPASLPEGAPANAMFARRESDGMDWYTYVNAGTNFGSGHVIIAAMFRPPSGQYIVGPATFEPTAMFPQGCIVHEVTDYTGSDPQADLGTKAFDPATGQFSDPIIPPPDARTDPLQALRDRIAALEAKQGGP